jgi:hypothetical protein
MNDNMTEADRARVREIRARAKARQGKGVIADTFIDALRDETILEELKAQEAQTRGL